MSEIGKVSIDELLYAMWEGVPRNTIRSYGLQDLKLHKRRDAPPDATGWDKYHKPQRSRLESITDQQVRSMLALVLAEAIDTATSHTYFIFHGEHFRQTKGLPIGGKLSSILAALFMDDWWQRVKAAAVANGILLPSTYLWYVDDGTGIWRGTLEQLIALKDLANSVDDDIEVKLEHTSPQCHKLTVLDIKLWVGHSGKLEFEFFRKEEAGDRCLPADSAHSKVVLANYIQSEVMRIKLRCSQQTYSIQHLQAFRHRLVKAGYPTWFITKHFRNGYARYEGILRQVEAGDRELYRSKPERRQMQGRIGARKGPPGPPVFWIPRVSDRFLANIRQAVRSSGLQLQVKETTGRTLKQSLTSPNPSIRLCNRQVVREVFDTQLDKGFWYKRDLVYRVKCRRCSLRYTGETKQPLHHRFYYHNYDYVNGNTEESALAEHYAECHPGEPMKLEIIGLYKTNGFVDRKASESVIAQILPSELNRRIEGGGVVGNLY